MSKTKNEIGLTQCDFTINRGKKVYKITSYNNLKRVYIYDITIAGSIKLVDSVNNTICNNASEALGWLTKHIDNVS